MDIKFNKEFLHKDIKLSEEEKHTCNIDYEYKRDISVVNVTDKEVQRMIRIYATRDPNKVNFISRSIYENGEDWLVETKGKDFWLKQLR